MNPFIVIPAYKPDTTLLSLAQDLTRAGAELIIVNDGSGTAYLSLFSQLEAMKGITVLHHAVNLGKGQALKTAFNYFLTHSPSITPGLITADADGQHHPHDILTLWRAFLENPTDLTIGSREFKKGIPWRSRFGNTLTRSIFSLIVGQKLQDTQTGLRAIPRSLLQSLLKAPSSGYDFELDMLIIATKKMKIHEIPIATIYMDNNKSSHFNPLMDSLKIYFVFLRYLAFSIVSGLLDFVAFSLAFLLCQQVFLSETLARLFSGTCNFFFNKELVFKSKHRIIPEACKYALLCAANLVFSYGLILSMVFMGISVYASKLIALTGLFVANFAIQRLMVFNREEEDIVPSIT